MPIVIPITLHREGVHPRVAHDHVTGLWQVVNVVREGLNVTLRLIGRQVRQRTVSTPSKKPLRSRPPELRHGFEEEYAHLVRSADLGLFEIFCRRGPPLYLDESSGVTRCGRDVRRLGVEIPR